MTEHANEEWVSIHLIQDEEEAEIIEGFLRSQDIPCELDSRYSHEFPAHVGQLGEIEVKVPESRAQEARELLASRDLSGSGSTPEAPEAADSES